MERIRALGRDHETTGARSIFPTDNGLWAVGISKGNESPAPKKDPNEDAALLVSHGTSAVACVADAHWGRESAEELIRALGESAGALLAGPETRLSQEMETAIERARRKLLHERVRSECAAILSVYRPPTLYWAEIGDCRLYLLRKDASKLDILSQSTKSYFGGAMPWPRFHLRTETIRKGRLLLATDGIPECVYGKEILGPEELKPLLEDGSAEKAATRLFDEVYAHGAEDNIAFVVGDVGG